jgi:hypothetical protein
MKRSSTPGHAGWGLVNHGPRKGLPRLKPPSKAEVKEPSADTEVSAEEEEAPERTSGAEGRQLLPWSHRPRSKRPCELNRLKPKGAWWRQWKLPRPPKGSFTGIGFILMLTLFSGQSGPIAHVSRILGAAAQVSEAAGDAASSVVLKGTAMSSAMSTAVIDITATSLGAMQTAWHGVDLVALTVHKISGTVTAESPQQVCRWLNSSSGQQLTTIDDELTMNTWVLMLQDVSSAMPHMQRSHECLLLNGSFLRVSGEVQMTMSSQTIFF